MKSSRIIFNIVITLLYGYQLMYLVYLTGNNQALEFFLYVLFILNIFNWWILYIHFLEFSKKILLVLSGLLLLILVNIYCYYYGEVTPMKIIIEPEFHILPIIIIANIIVKRKRSYSLYYKMTDYYNQGEYDKALKTLEQWFKTSPHEIRYYDLKGRLYLAKGQPEKVIKELEEPIKKSLKAAKEEDIPIIDYIDNYLNLAWSYGKTNKEEKALYYYFKALKCLKKVNEEDELIYERANSIYYGIARLFYIKKDYEKAISYLKEIKNQELYNDLDILYLYALIIFKLEKLNEAEELFKQLLQKDYQYKNCCLYHLVKIYYEKNEREKMMEYLLEASQKKADFYLKCYNEINLNEEELEKLFEHIKSLFELIKHRSIKDYEVVLLLCTQLEKINTARDYLEMMKNEIPEHRDIYYWSIIIALLTGKYEEAREIYKKVTKKEERFFDYYNWCELDMDTTEVKRLLENKNKQGSS